MAKTESDEDSANDRVSATQEKTTIAPIAPGIGTRFRIATTASDYHPIFEGAQLTVSSVNTILEDLPETEDEDDDAPRGDTYMTSGFVWGKGVLKKIME